MIRVLNVISNLNNAGTEAVVMNYYRHMDREKVQFDFLVLDTGDGYYEDEITQLGGKIYKITPFSKHPFKNFFKKRKFFKEHKYDVVEVHSPSVLRYGYCKVAKKGGAKAVIFHVHNFSTQKGFFVNHARKQIAKYCAQTVTCSQDAAVSVLGKKADKVIYNAIPCEAYKFNAEKRSELRSFYGIDDNTQVLGHVGRFSEQKNHVFLIDAFAEAVKTNGNLKLLLKGFGELKQQVEERIKALKLEDKIIIAEEGHSAAELYNAFDVFVFPSLWEGLGVVMIEAQINGLQCVASTAVPTIADISDKTVFLPLDKSQWVKTFCDNNLYNRLTPDKNGKFEEYDIVKAAQSRQAEYLEMVK